MNRNFDADPVPAVKERDATGETARIFADIRESLGTSTINLIWRHLATLPGALEWCWKTVEPLHESGTIAVMAAGYRERLSGPTLPALPSELAEVLRLRPDDIETIRTTLEAYFVSCSMNAISLNALRLALRHEGSRHAASMAPPAAGSPIPAMVFGKPAKLLSTAEMAPEVRTLVWRLNAIGEMGDGTILASLYRYLANWPNFLAVSWSLIAPLAEDGRLREAIGQSLRGAESDAGRLLPNLDVRPTDLDDATRDAVLWALDNFARNAIVKVIPITRALLSSLDSPMVAKRP